jgi:hypothetical protein
MLLNKYLYVQIKKNEMGRECGMFIGEEKCTEGFGRKTWKKQDILGDLDLGGNILLKLI